MTWPVSSEAIPSLYSAHQYSMNATSFHSPRSSYNIGPELITQSSQRTEFSDTSADSSWSTPNAVNGVGVGYATIDRYTHADWAYATGHPLVVQEPTHEPPSGTNPHNPAPSTSQSARGASVPDPPASPVSSRHAIDTICTIRDQSRQGAACGFHITYMGYDRQALVVHLQSYHGVNHSNLNSHAPGEPLIECPDIGCMCRFRRKECVRRDANGRIMPHRTHVVDIIRHYIDKHLQPVIATNGRGFDCDLCGKEFTRYGSMTRHKRNNCPRRSHK
jgi:hypothetical protein